MTPQELLTMLQSELPGATITTAASIGRLLEDIDFTGADQGTVTAIAEELRTRVGDDRNEDTSNLSNLDRFQEVVSAQAPDLAIAVSDVIDAAEQQSVDDAQSRIDASADVTQQEIVDSMDTDGDEIVGASELIAGGQSTDARVRAEAERLAIEEWGMPTWALNQAQVGNQGITPESALEDLLTAVAADTGVRYGSWDEIPEEYKRNQAAEAGTSSFLPDQVEEPFTLKREYELEDGTTELVGLDVAQAAMDTFNFSEDTLANTIKLAHREGLDRQGGEGFSAWQPLAALLRATSQDADDLFEREALKDEAVRLGRLWRTLQSAGKPDQPRIDAAYEAFRAAQREWMDSPTGRDASNLPSQLARRYEKGYEIYGGNDVLAFMHVLDEPLAARINQVNGDTDMLTLEERNDTFAYVSQAFPGAANLDQLVSKMIGVGFGEAGSGLVQLAVDAAAAAGRGGGGGSGPTRVLPDRVKVEQAAKDFYQQLFLEEPDEATVKSFADQILSDVANSPIEQDVDVNARIRLAAESDPKFQELYGKRGNLDVAEYQGMMRAGTSSMLGDELAGHQSTKLGMRSGKYQTAVGAAMGTNEAWDNSTFLGRLAKAAQTVSANT